MSAGSLDLGTLHLKMRADKDGLRRDLKDGEREVEQSRARMKKSLLETALDWARSLGSFFRRSGSDAIDGFFRNAGGRLRDHRGRFVAEGKTLAQGFGGMLQAGLVQIISLFGGLWGALQQLPGGMGTLALVVGVLAAAFLFLIPTVYAVGGALGALPAIITGGIAAVGTLIIGFTGLAEAFKETKKQGGAVTDQAHQVMLAQRRLADAQQEVLDVTEALNRARKEEAERLEDVDRGVRGALLDQLDARDALTEAEKNLAKAEKSKDPRKIDEATRAYARAQLALETVEDRVQDLSEEQEKAARVGVEGSDQVQAALERQRRATIAVEDAQYALQQAQKRTGAGAVEETTKIAKSAQIAVDAIKGLRGEWENLRLDVQEKLFAGVGPELTGLWDAWDSTLHTRLGSMASTFNGLFKTWAETSKDPEFIENIDAGWASVEEQIDKVGEKVAGPGLLAFGRLSAAADPFLDKIGDKLAGVVDHFATWIEDAEKSGKLERFFDKASDFFGKLWQLGGDVIGIIGEFWSMWNDSDNGDAAVGAFDSILNALHGIREWLKDPENKATLKAFLDGMARGFTIVVNIASWLVDKGLPAVGDAFERVNGWVKTAKQKFSEAGEFLAAVFSSPVVTAKAAFNAIASLWNKTLGATRISFPDWLPPPLGGKSFGFPSIPQLADGGLVKAVPGGRIVTVAEGGEDEIVSPESQMRRIVAEELARVAAEGGGAGGVHVDQLIVKAYNDRFSVAQVERELALHGVH